MSCERLRIGFSFPFLGADFPAVTERSLQSDESSSGLFNREVALDWSFENTATVNFCISRKQWKILWIVASELGCILSSNILKKLMGYWNTFLPVTAAWVCLEAVSYVSFLCDFFHLNTNGSFPLKNKYFGQCQQMYEISVHIVNSAWCLASKLILWKDDPDVFPFYKLVIQMTPSGCLPQHRFYMRPARPSSICKYKM